MEFEYTTFKGTNNGTYLRVSMTYDQRVFAEDCRVYWFHMVWGMPFAKHRILNRILKELR